MTTAEKNAKTSRQEVATFAASAPSPYFAYYTTRRSGEVGARHTMRAGVDSITTWTGDELAAVIHAGEEYVSGFGDRRQNFRARSIDGRTIYSGTAFLSAGDYVRMRKVRGDA